MNVSNRLSMTSVTALIACCIAHASDPSDAQPSRMPTLLQKQASSMPAYVPVTGVVEECLGRLVWTADKAVAWPVRYDRGQSAKFNHAFSENVFSRGDEIRFGKTRISVNALEPGVKEEVIGLLPANRVAELKKNVLRLETNLEKAEKGKNGDERERNQYHVAKTRLESAKKTIEQMTKKYRPFDPGIRDSYGYWASDGESTGSGDEYSIYRAYLFTADYLYTFESRETLGPNMSVESHGKQFSSLLTSFRPRRMNEIPTELGVCIPFGFLPDDGRTVTDIKQSLRWADAPGVLYTIHTGNVQPRQLKSTVMMALANSQVGRLGSNEETQVKQHVDQRIGPRQVSIGGLRGEQGGVALKVSQPGAAAYEAYSVFTGYSGWLGTDVLPFILIDVQTFTLEQAPELKVNPPPFKQSMQRLDWILKNMRLRQTNPPMPELAGGR